MDSVWIVFDESEPDDKIVGVFGDSAEAESFAQARSDTSEIGVLIKNYPVPWRCSDGTGIISSQ